MSAGADERQHVLSRMWTQGSRFFGGLGAEEENAPVSGLSRTVAVCGALVALQSAL